MANEEALRAILNSPAASVHERREAAEQLRRIGHLNGKRDPQVQSLIATLLAQTGVLNLRHVPLEDMERFRRERAFSEAAERVNLIAAALQALSPTGLAHRYLNRAEDAATLLRLLGYGSTDEELRAWAHDNIAAAEKLLRDEGMAAQ